MTAKNAAPTQALATREAALLRMEQLIEENSLEKIAAASPMRRTLQMASALEQLRQAIEPFMPELLRLQGSRLGFLTDNKTYPPDVVREVMVEAHLRGARPVFNEVNIIGGNLYLTKQFFRRALKEYPGLTDLRLSPGVPVTKQGGAVVPFKATWRLNGVADSLELEIPVRVNAGMGVDAILGKADRKMKAAIYNQLTGSDSDFEAPDGEVGDVIDVEAKPSTASASPEKSPEERVLEQHGEAEPEQATIEEATEPEAPKAIGKDAVLWAQDRIYSREGWSKVDKDDAWMRLLAAIAKEFQTTDPEQIPHSELERFEFMVDDIVTG